MQFHDHKFYSPILIKCCNHFVNYFKAEHLNFGIKLAVIIFDCALQALTLFILTAVAIFQQRNYLNFILISVS